MIIHLNQITCTNDYTSMYIYQTTNANDNMSISDDLQTTQIKTASQMHVAPRIVVHCCPLLTVCPRWCPSHAPGDAPDIPQMLSQTCPRWCPRHAPDDAPDMPQTCLRHAQMMCQTCPSWCPRHAPDDPQDDAPDLPQTCPRWALRC